MEKKDILITNNYCKKNTFLDKLEDILENTSYEFF